MSLQDIVVTVTGGNQNARAIVAGLTTQVLEENGFDSVVNTVIETETNDVPTSERVKTLLDLCRASGHAVFNTPVTVEDGTVVVDEPDDDAVDPDEE